MTRNEHGALHPRCYLEGMVEAGYHSTAATLRGSQNTSSVLREQSRIKLFSTQGAKNWACKLAMTTPANSCSRRAASSSQL